MVTFLYCYCYFTYILLLLFVKGHNVVFHMLCTLFVVLFFLFILYIFFLFCCFVFQLHCGKKNPFDRALNLREKPKELATGKIAKMNFFFNGM